jgi:hypothetical protein
MNAPINDREQHAIEQKPWIGASVPRPNARRLVEGAAVYVDDIRLPRTFVFKNNFGAFLHCTLMRKFKYPNHIARRTHHLGRDFIHFVLKI